jgi:site-specific recombinase XerD
MKIKKESRSLIDHINNWLKVYLPQARGYSSKTIESYETGLSLFIDFLESEKHIRINEFNETCFKRDVIEDWLTWLSSKRNNGKRTLDQAPCNNQILAQIPEIKGSQFSRKLP